MPTEVNDQLALDEQTIVNPALEKALEARQARREALAEYRKTYEESDRLAAGEIEKLELPEGHAVRVGRFRITRSAVGERSVAFTTKATSRVTIAFLGEE